MNESKLPFMMLSLITPHWREVFISKEKKSPKEKKKAAAPQKKAQHVPPLFFLIIDPQGLASGLCIDESMEYAWSVESTLHSFS